MLFRSDVAAQKARTAVFFSEDTRAFSSRTVGFLAQQFYPPGIANTAPGPFYTLQERFSLLPAGVRNPLNGVVRRMRSRSRIIICPMASPFFPAAFLSIATA